VNYHMLSDFRSQHGERWDAMLTQIVGSLLATGLVSMKRAAQDGMKVRAHAGKSSFRRRGRLEECLKEARQQVEALQQQVEEEDQEKVSRARQAAQQRAAADRERRVAEALRNCESLQRQREASAKKSGRQAKEARASSTDPEARVMQFSDGGYRPGYNVQLSTDTDSGVIVGVMVTNAGNDLEQMAPMLAQIQENHGLVPEQTLADGGFASLQTIEAATALGTTVYAPPKDEQKQLQAGKDPYAPKRGDSPVVTAWRARMKEPSAKLLYRLRCQTAEWVNAIFRNRGLYQFQVRGQRKVQTVATLHAITHNLMIALKLRTTSTANG